MPDLRRLANDHWRAAYRVLVDMLGGEWRDFGSVQAFATPHVNYTFVNGCVALDAPSDPADLAAAIRWLAPQRAWYRVRIDAGLATPQLLDVAAAFGHEGDETWRMPGMVLPEIAPAPAVPSGIVARRLDIELAAALPEYLAATDSPHRAFLETLAVPSLRSDDLAIYIAELEGRFAATSAVIRTGESCGIYAVGTALWARRRGVGTAVTWATLEHARTEWGCTVAALQSSPVGVLVYEKMGFRVVAEYQLFDAPVGSYVTQ